MLFVAFGRVLPLSAMQKYTSDKACHLTSCLSCFTAKEKTLENKVAAHNTLSSFYMQLLEKHQAAPQKKAFLSPLAFVRGMKLETIAEEDGECCEFETLLNDEPWKQEIK